MKDHFVGTARTSLLVAALVLLLSSLVAPATAQDGAAPSIAIGDVRIGTLHSASPVSRYSLLTPESATVVIEVLAASPGFVPAFRVLDANGVVVFTATNAAARTIVEENVHLPSAGQYLLEIYGEQGTMGDYVLTVQAGPPLAEPEPLAVGDAVEDAVDGGGNLLVYTFSPMLDQDVLVTVRSERDDAGPNIVLIDATTEQILALSSGRVTAAQYRVPMGGGSYRLEVAYSGSGAPEPFTVCLESEDGAIVCPLGSAAPTATPTPLDSLAEMATATVSAATAQSQATIEAVLTGVPTATPEPVSVQACVASPAGGLAVNVRSGPGIIYPIISGFSGGAQANVIGRSGDLTWWQINLSGLVGWVSAPYVVVQGDCATVPLAIAPPTPIPPPPTATYTPTSTFTPSNTPTITPTPTRTPTPSITPTFGGGIVLTLNPGVLTALAPGNLQVNPNLINPALFPTFTPTATPTP